MTMDLHLQDGWKFVQAVSAPPGTEVILTNDIGQTDFTEAVLFFVICTDPEGGLHTLPAYTLPEEGGISTPHLLEELGGSGDDGDRTGKAIVWGRGKGIHAPTYPDIFVDYITPTHPYDGEEVASRLDTIRTVVHDYLEEKGLLE